MQRGKAHQIYHKNDVNTATQKQLIVMLYDGMNQYLTQAIQAIDNSDLEAAHRNLHQTGKILLELLNTLREDRGGAISTNLKKIYVYCYEQVVMANLKKDTKIICAVRSILAQLGDGWKNIRKKDSKISYQSSLQLAV